VGKSPDLASYLKRCVILGNTVVQLAIVDEKAELILSGLLMKPMSLAGRLAQADTAAPRAKGDSGLGLLISQEAVLQMQGEICFVSTAGQGAR